MFKLMKVLCAGIILLLMVQESKLIEREPFKMEALHSLILKSKAQPYKYNKWDSIRCIHGKKPKSLRVLCSFSRFLARLFSFTDSSFCFVFVF